MTNPHNIAAKAVERIITDISDRSGLGNEWEQIDSGVQDEIRNQWSAIIIGEIQKALDT